MPEQTEHVYLVNGKPLAASNVVPDSALSDVLDSKADVADLNAFVTDVKDAGGTSLVDQNTHEAKINETTDEEISGILAALN
jgi:hypothetical protein